MGEEFSVWFKVRGTGAHRIPVDLQKETPRKVSGAFLSLEVSLSHFTPVEKITFDAESGLQVDLADGAGTLLDKSPGPMFSTHVDTKAG